MTEQNWDETESEEDRDVRFEQWLEFSRSLWLIWKDRQFFMGVWEIEQPYDDDTGMMLLVGRPTWPEVHHYERVEVHKLPRRDRPDKYQPIYRLHAFANIMAIRPVEKPIKREKKGQVTMLRLDQGAEPTHLRLYGKIVD